MSSRCGGCGARKSSPSSACTVCGMTPSPRWSTPPLPPRAPSVVRVAAAPSHRRRQSFVALFSLIAVLGCSGFLLARSSKPSGLLSVMGQRAHPAGGGLFSGVRQPMPADVIAYLRWLKWFESERHRMQLNQVFSLAPLATTAAYADLLSEDAPPIQGPPELAVAKRFEEKVSPVVKGWGATVEVFDKQPAPAPCQELASTYRSGMINTKSAIGSILEKTVGTIRQIAGQKNKEELAQPTLRWLQDQKDNKALSQSADDGFHAANLALAKLRSQYREIPVDIDQAHFLIVPEDSKLPFALPTLPSGLLGK